MKAVLRHPKLLMELCELMRPLWAAAEAADEPVLPSCAEEQQQQDQSDAPMDADTGGTENDDDNADADATPEETAAFCENRLGLEVERAMLSVIGTKRRRTYGHDMVYGLPGLYMMLGKPYLGACKCWT
mmetsp:Transcript_2210/g.5673  ORF Transcript_2210/g.5673 Transcript_2210/m.5673 type:complete len:129 (+) Transcript_2210:415-801(+)